MSDKLFSWSVVADKADVSIPFRLLSTAGAAVTGKTATNLTLSYWRQGGTRTAITASDLAAVNSAHSDGGVKEVDATNFPGLYRLDLPDAAVASGADWVCIGVVCSGAMDYETWLPIQSAGTVEIYSRIGAPAGASVVADIAALPVAVWAAGTRTLTQPAASIVSAINGSEITAYRGTTWSIALTGLGNITGYTNLWFAIKQSSVYNTDNESIVLIGINSGLTRIDGAAYPTSSDGSITVNDATAGNVTITLKPAASSLLKIQSDLDYGIKWINASGSEYQLSDGTQKFNIAADNPRAIA